MVLGKDTGQSAESQQKGKTNGREVGEGARAGGKEEREGGEGGKEPPEDLDAWLQIVKGTSNISAIPSNISSLSPKVSAKSRLARDAMGERGGGGKQRSGGDGREREHLGEGGRERTVAEQGRGAGTAGAEGRGAGAGARAEGRGAGGEEGERVQPQAMFQTPMADVTPAVTNAGANFNGNFAFHDPQMPFRCKKTFSR